MSASTLVKDQAAPGVGQWVKVRNIKEERSIAITITGTASVTVEASNDGVNPVPLMSGITATSGYLDDGPWEYMRINVNSISSGTVTAVMGEQA